MLPPMLRQATWRAGHLVGWIVLVGDAACGKPFYFGSNLRHPYHLVSWYLAVPSLPAFVQEWSFPGCSGPLARTSPSLCPVLMSPQCAFARSAPWAHWPRQAQGVAVERGADDVKPVGGIRRACIHRGRRAFQATPSGRCCSYALGFCVQKCSAFHQAICCRISSAHR